jgi:hypothetical protein
MVNWIEICPKYIKPEFWILPDEFFTSAIETKAVDFRIHHLGQALQHFRVGHVDLVQQDPLAVLWVKF